MLSHVEKLLALRSEIDKKATSSMDQTIEADRVAKLIAANPWQEVSGPPRKKKTGGWLIPSKHVYAMWPHDEIPHAHSIYVKQDVDGYQVLGIYDIHGKLHHR